MDANLETYKKNIQSYMSAILSRAEFAASLGQQYGGERDIYDALGYPKNLTYQNFVSQYSRQDIARAIIDRPSEENWRDGFTVRDDVINDTEFSKAFHKLYKEFGLKGIFTRVDKLTCLGRYGVLYLGFNDTSNRDDLRKPVRLNSKLKLNYIKPLGEDSAKIAEWETRTANPRYGKPQLYNITVQNPTGSNSSTSVVHYSRIIHITKDLMESEVYGTPELMSVWNRLMDLEKLTGGSAEMFWRGARPGYQAITKDGYSLPEGIADDMKEQFQEWEDNLRRILTLDGVEMKGLEIQVANPIEHVKTQLQMISADKGIPLRILTGSEVGELASSQDRNNWLETVHSRRKDHAEPNIIDKFVDTMMDYNILPKVDEYTVLWSDLFSLSEKAQAEIGASRAAALASYAQYPLAMEMFPPEVFVEIQGYPDHLKQKVLDGLNSNIVEEVKSIRESEENNIDG